MTTTITTQDLRMAYSVPAKEVLVNVINAANPGSKYIVEDFIWGSPKTNTNSTIPCNTELELAGSPATKRSGVETIWYNRIDIATLFEGSDVAAPVPANAVMLSEVIPQINQLFGIYLTTDDYVDTPLPYDPVDHAAVMAVSITIKPDSLLFTGEAVVRFGKTDYFGLAQTLGIANAFMFSEKDALAGRWINKLNSQMMIDTTWSPVGTKYAMRPSAVTDHAVLARECFVFVGDLTYATYPVAGPEIIHGPHQGVAIVGKEVVILDDVILGQPSIASIASKEKWRIYACNRGANPGHLLLGLYCTSPINAAFNVLVDVVAGFQILGIAQCANDPLFVANRASRFTDIVPIHYCDDTLDSPPQYMRCVYASNVVYITALNAVLQPVNEYTPWAVAFNDVPIVGLIRPHHFSFTGRTINGQENLLMSIKSDTDSYTAPQVTINGMNIIAQANDEDSRPVMRAWLGSALLRKNGAASVGGFYCDIISYQAFRHETAMMAKTMAPSTFVLQEGTGFSALRKRRNPFGDVAATSVYPVCADANDQIVLRGMNQFFMDQSMTTIYDAFAIEITSPGLPGAPVSKGFAWCLVGLAAARRADIAGDQRKALTYMVFDQDGVMIRCSQSDINTLWVDDNDAGRYRSGEMCLWLTRN